MHGKNATQRNGFVVNRSGARSFRWLAILMGTSIFCAGPSVFAADPPAAAPGVMTLPITAPAPTSPPLWRNPDKPLDDRIKDLIGQMSLEEKSAQICEKAPAIPRLGIPAYNYWNECLHGVARSGIATVFPQAIGLAASWDPQMLHDVADIIATEARAKNRAYTELHNGDSAQFTGLNFWTPNINIFRDPRWGRGQETYGEDTFLTARMAVAFVKGLQGDDPTYVKALACAKHFAVHSGPEQGRYEFNVMPSERDLYETYLPHFEAAVREGHVGAVMASYNSLNGVPAACNPFLLTDTLRTKWGFDGHVVSDCGAINHIWDEVGHKYAKSMEEAEALSVKAGCDLGCWGGPAELTRAVKQGLMTEKDMDVALARVLKARFKLGLFDPPARVPYSKIPITDNDTADHARMSLRAACESVVLLKNDSVLPLDRSKIKKIAVIGLNANSLPVLLGDYYGEPSHPVSMLQGIKDLAGTNVEILYSPGCSLATALNSTTVSPSELAAHSNAVEYAKAADVVIYIGGINGIQLESEQIDVNLDGFFGGDRTRIELPAVQTALLKDLQATGKPVVFVNCSGSAMAIPWEAEHLPAIVQAWYPGEVGGLAIAEILFGEVNPGGKLPITFYRSTADLPDFSDYSMANRTYRYFNGKPLYAFGHGLSYTTFDYKSVKCDQAEVAPDGKLHVSLEVANTGAKDGDEVVQVYFRHVNSAVPQPRQALCGFRRVSVAHGQSAHIEIEVPVKEFRYWDVAKKDYTVEAGKYELLVGAASDDIRSKIPLTVTAAK